MSDTAPLDICLMFGMNLRPQEHSKLLKMAPDKKKSGHPCNRQSSFETDFWRVKIYSEVFIQKQVKMIASLNPDITG